MFPARNLQQIRDNRLVNNQETWFRDSNPSCPAKCLTQESPKSAILAVPGHVGNYPWPLWRERELLGSFRGVQCHKNPNKVCGFYQTLPSYTVSLYAHIVATSKKLGCFECHHQPHDVHMLATLCHIHPKRVGQWQVIVRLGRKCVTPANDINSHR